MTDNLASTAEGEFACEVARQSSTFVSVVAKTEHGLDLVPNVEEVEFAVH